MKMNLQKKELVLNYRGSRAHKKHMLICGGCKTHEMIYIGIQIGSMTHEIIFALIMSQAPGPTK
jgi:hypothetical protein